MQTNRILIVLWLLAIISPVLVFGTDYQTVHKNGISYFNNAEDRISCIRIDSAKVDIDSVFYPFTILQHVVANCYSPYKASWIGEKVIVKENGDNLFFNKFGDSILLKTQAKKGESWLAAQVDDSLFIEASVQEHDTLNFLGLTDSVKTIAFKVKDKDQSLLEYDLNHMQVKISKKYGFVQALNFYMFPNVEEDYIIMEKFEERALCGLSNPKVGFQNLTWMEVNDFQVGDEIHVIEIRNNEGIGNAGGIVSYETKRFIYHYLERISNDIEVIYKVEVIQSLEKKNSFSPDQNSYTFSVDTVFQTFKPDSIFDKLPGEPSISQELFFLGHRYFEMNFNYPTTKWKSYLPGSPSGDLPGSPSEEWCWTIDPYDGCMALGNFRKGLGGPYYVCNYMGNYERNLVYYKKGETTWGDPLEINAVNDISIQNHVKIYPNPAVNSVNIELTENLGSVQFELRNILGQKVISTNLNETMNRIETSHLPKGTYLYRIKTTDYRAASGKIMIK